MVVFQTVSRKSMRSQEFMLMLEVNRELPKIIFFFGQVFGGLLSRRKRIPKARCHTAFRLGLDYNSIARKLLTSRVQMFPQKRIDALQDGIIVSQYFLGMAHASCCLCDSYRLRSP